MDGEPVETAGVVVVVVSTRPGWEGTSSTREEQQPGWGSLQSQSDLSHFPSPQDATVLSIPHYGRELTSELLTTLSPLSPKHPGFPWLVEF